MRSKAVRRRTFNSAVATDEDVWLEDLRGRVWAYQGRSTWKDMAASANIARTTLINFASGDTKRPTFHTIYKLVDITGSRIMITDRLRRVK